MNMSETLTRTQLPDIADHIKWIVDSLKDRNGRSLEFENIVHY